MTRIATTYYGADPTTQFQWATAGSDQFSRIYDLYYLAQALEYHDHSNARGLAVARVADGSLTAASYGALSVGTAALANGGVTNPKLGDLSVSTAKLQDSSVTAAKLAALSVATGSLQDSSVTNAKIATGTIADNKMANAKVSKTGDTMTNSLSINESSIGSALTGYVRFGDGTHRLGYNGSSLDADGFALWHQGNDGSGSGLDADLLDGHDSSFFATASSVAAIVGVPSGIIAFVPTAAQIPSGWTRYTAGDGRLLAGAGTVFSQTFPENANVGSSNWTPVTGLTTDVPTSNFVAAAAAANNATGSTGVGTSTHLHTINGQGAAWVPPARAVVWCQKS